MNGLNFFSLVIFFVGGTPSFKRKLTKETLVSFGVKHKSASDSESIHEK